MIEPATIGALSAIGASCTWAMGSAVYSRLSSHHSAFAVNFARAWIAWPLFVITAFIMAGSYDAARAEFAAITGTQVFWMTLSIVASYGCGDVVFLWSSRLIGVPGALAIASAYPLWTAFIGVIFHGESRSAGRWAGLLLTLTGVITVILNIPSGPRGEDQEHSRRRVALGVFLAVSTSLFWTLNSYSVSRGMSGVSAPIGNTIRMMVALGISAALNWTLGRGAPILLPWKELRPVFWLFAVESFGGSFFYLTAFAKAPLVVAATLTSLAPVISVPVAWLLKLEKFSVWRTIGVVTVVFGLWLLVNGQ